MLGHTATVVGTGNIDNTVISWGQHRRILLFGGHTEEESPGSIFVINPFTQTVTERYISFPNLTSPETFQEQTQGTYPVTQLHGIQPKTNSSLLEEISVEPLLFPLSFSIGTKMVKTHFGENDTEETLQEKKMDLLGIIIQWPTNDPVWFYTWIFTFF